MTIRKRRFSEAHIRFFMERLIVNHIVSSVHVRIHYFGTTMLIASAAAHYCAHVIDAGFE